MLAGASLSSCFAPLNTTDRDPVAIGIILVDLSILYWVPLSYQTEGPRGGDSAERQRKDIQE